MRPDRSLFALVRRAVPQLMALPVWLAMRLPVGLLVVPMVVSAQVTSDAPVRTNPVAIVDLRMTAGAALVGATWRYQDASIVEIDHHAVGRDLRPSGPPNRTRDLLPHAGLPGFDDSAWPVVPAESLEARRGNGRLSFGWYRTRVTIPQRIGPLDPTGHRIVFELVVDDYAEVWVNGQLPVMLGQAGGPYIRGFNAPNRVLLTRDARPGQRFDIAFLMINGPLSNVPGNYLWVRSATLDLHAPSAASGALAASGGVIARTDPGLDRIVAKDAVIEKLAGGFQFIEGPVWVKEGGYLLFSDPNANVIYRWSPDGQVSVFRTKSGYSGTDIGAYHQPGSNGLTIDADGRVTVNEHGNRRVTRIERTGAITVLADRYQGKRLNSPNDLVYRSDGTLYFTDPPFGLPKVFDDPKKETPWSGVYRLHDGVLTLEAKEFTGPNGLAFSPDERTLYVDNWDVKRKVVMQYDVAADGALSSGRVFADLTGVPGDVALDGIKVDREGHVFVAGPGGVWVFSPSGKHLGTISPPEHVANMAWGDADGRTLYLAASTGLYRVRLNVPGAGTPAVTASR
jgi:gluconolactonase